jgi:hypothetical protein
MGLRMPSIGGVPTGLTFGLSGFLRRLKEAVEILTGQAAGNNIIVYIGSANLDAAGNWRITDSGDDLVIQKREGNTWVTKQTITG